MKSSENIYSDNFYLLHGNKIWNCFFRGELNLSSQQIFLFLESVNYFEFFISCGSFHFLCAYQNEAQNHHININFKLNINICIVIKTLLNKWRYAKTCKNTSEKKKKNRKNNCEKVFQDKSFKLKFICMQPYAGIASQTILKSYSLKVMWKHTSR